MTRGQVAALAASGESETLEFKATTGARREAAMTVCAFLNQGGGQVLFGVTPGGDVVGQQVSERTIEELSAELGRIEPPAFPTIERVSVDGDRDVIVVSTSQGASRPYTYRGSAYLYSATFDSYENIIALCISEGVDALLVAGDIYDGADRSLRAQRAFIDGLRSLDAAGIRSFVCHGNHDPLDGWEARLSYPDSCRRFGPEFAPAPIFPNEPERALVYGISYPTRDVYENLVSRLGPVDKRAFTIGLVHANVGGNTDHALYAPCSLDDLAQSGIDYWALGHVHTRQVLGERTPTVVYPGNPQGRHPNETGARGVYLVEVDANGDARLEFRPTDTVRWERVRIDIGALETEQDLLDAIDDAMQILVDGAEGRSVVARMTLTGRGELNQFLRQPGAVDDLLAGVSDQWAQRLPFVWCERIEDETAAAINRDALRSGEDFLAEVLRTADQLRETPEMLRDGLAELYQHRRFRQHLSDFTEEEIAELLDEAEALAVNLLAEDDR